MSNAKIKKVDISQIKYTPQIGEVVQDTATGNFMVWTDEGWNTVKSEGSSINMGLYEINKQIIAQLPAIEQENIQEKIDMINDFAVNNKNYYYMLYGKEISYFTLFKRVPNYEEDCIGKVMIECLNSIGDIKAIDYTEAQDAIEVWVECEDGPTCLYLFPYDSGVVSVGE